MHRKILTSLLWSSENQLILGTREPGNRRIQRMAMPSLMGSIPGAWGTEPGPVTAPISSPDMASSQVGLGPCHTQLEKELEASTAMASPGTGPIGKELVGAPGTAEQGCKSLFLPSGAWQSCVLLSSSVQFLSILHSSWSLSWCTLASSFLVSLVFFPMHTFFSIYAGHYFLSSVPVSHWKTSIT